MSESFTLQISEGVAGQIRAHGARSYPHECCGALLGSDESPSSVRESGPVRTIRSLYPLINRREDSPHNRFSVTPADVLEAEKAARAEGWEVVGWYHSHPDHPARPSVYDRDHAWPFYSYLIVSVQDGEPQEMTSWRLSQDRSDFFPEGIEIRSQAEASR